MPQKMLVYDGIALLTKFTGSLVDKATKDLNKILDLFGLMITAQVSKKTVYFLDVTFNLGIAELLNRTTQRQATIHK